MGIFDNYDDSIGGTINKTPTTPKVETKPKSGSIFANFDSQIGSTVQPITTPQVTPNEPITPTVTKPKQNIFQKYQNWSSGIGQKIAEAETSLWKGIVAKNNSMLEQQNKKKKGQSMDFPLISSSLTQNDIVSSSKNIDETLNNLKTKSTTLDKTNKEEVDQYNTEVQKYQNQILKYNTDLKEYNTAIDVHKNVFKENLATSTPIFRSFSNNLSTLATELLIKAPAEALSNTKYIKDVAAGANLAEQEGKPDFGVNFTEEMTRKLSMLTKSVSAFTGGLVNIEPPKPEELDFSDKIVSLFAQGVGIASGLGLLEVGIAKTIPSITSISSLASKYPTMAKYAVPFMRTATAFTAYGQLNQTLDDASFQERLKTAGIDFVKAIPYFALGLTNKAWVSIPASGLLGYGAAKLEGATNEDAIASGISFMALDGFARASAPRGVSYKRGLITQQEARNTLNKQAIEIINKYSDIKITEKSSKIEIEKAYRDAAKKTHPDITGSDVEFKKVNGAKDILIPHEVIEKIPEATQEKTPEPKETKVGKAVDEVPNLRQEVTDSINTVGPEETYSMLKNEAGMDSKTARKVIENVMNQNAVEQPQTTTQEVDSATIIQQALADNELDSTLADMKETPTEQPKLKISKAEQTTGPEVLKYAQDLGGETIHSNAKEAIKSQNYTLQEVEISEILKNDPDAKEYVDANKNRYGKQKQGVDNPIIIGEWQGKPSSVIDGYNRLLTKIQNGETTIKAYVSGAQGEAKMKIKESLTDEQRDEVSKLLDGLDTKPLTVNGKPDLSNTDLYFRLDQLKTKNEGGKLTNEEYVEAKALLEEVGLKINKGLDIKKTKEDNKTYGIKQTNRESNNRKNDGEIQLNKGTSRSINEDVSISSTSKEGTNIQKTNIRGASRGKSARLQVNARSLEAKKIISEYLSEANPEVIDQIVFYNDIYQSFGKDFIIDRSETYNGRTDFDAFVRLDGNLIVLTVKDSEVNDLSISTINHENAGHVFYDFLNNEERKIFFSKIKEQYNLNKKLFYGFNEKGYWEMLPDFLKYHIIDANPGTNNDEAYYILQKTGFLDENNEVIYPENILETIFNFEKVTEKLDKYLIQNGYKITDKATESNNLMAHEIVAYIAQEPQIFTEATIKEVKDYAENVENNNLEFKKPEITDDEFSKFKLKPSTNLTAKDIIKKHANIELKRDIVITDVYGEKATLKAGEGITPYEVTGNKFILQDGEAYLVSKSQAQNVINNSKNGEAKPFAPELKQTEETVKGGPTLKFDDIKWTGEKENLKGTLGNRKFGIQKEGDSWYVYEENAVLGNKAINYTDAVEKLERYLAKDTPVTKYSSYTLPGGENYKEILIKAPNNETTERNAQLTDKYKRGLISLDQYKQGLEYRQTGVSNFKSSHWDEPNVISHIRMNERTYNGKKVAFMEELQSDWAREGRDKGFSKDISEAKKRLNFYEKQLEKKYTSGENGTMMTNEERDILNDLKSQASNDGTIPNNPLLKNWQELSIKRALQEAVNSNAKYFAWINGPQTAARYNLSKEVDSIKWVQPGGSGNKTIQITPKSGSAINVIVDQKGKVIGSGLSGTDGWTGKELSEVIGKGVAEKIMQTTNGNLEGNGLNFGGEWANTLYDKQVPNIIKNLTGAEVKTLDMGLPVDAKGNVKWFNQITQKELQPSEIKVGLEMSSAKQGGFGSDNYIITDVLGDGKFKAIAKEATYPISTKAEYSGQTFKKINDKIKYDNKTYQEQEFDISEKKSIGQQAIELTPEVKAIINGEARQIAKPSGVLPFAEQMTAPVMFKLKQPISLPVNEKLKDATIKQIFNERIDQITPTTGEYQFKTKDEVLTFINKNKGKKFMSSIINAPFEVNEITKQHLYDKYRPQSDYERRTKLFGPGLEIAESKGILVGIDAITDKAIGITYYDIIGIDPNMPNIIIKVKLSEENKNGKAYFTVSEISGGAPVPATPSRGRRLGRLTTSESITKSIPPSEKESQVGDVKFKIKLPDVNTGNKVEDTKQILKFVEKKLGVSSVVNSLQEKKALIEVAKEAINESPMAEFESSVADGGEFKGELPEVIGKPIAEIKKMKAFKGIRNPKALEFAQKGDVLVEGVNMNYGTNYDSEDVRAEFENYQRQKADIAKREKEVKKQIELFGKTDTFQLLDSDKRILANIVDVKNQSEEIRELVEKVREEKKIRREEVLNHPARPLMKYISKKTGKLSENFAEKSIQILEDLKFKDIKEANKAIEDYVSKKNEFVNPLSRMRLEERNAKFLRDKQKIIAEVEKKIKAEAKGRKETINSIRDYFYITDSEMRDIIGNVDFRLLNDAQFQELTKKIEEKALKIAEHAVAVSEVEWTIAQKELQKTDNFLQAMKLPTDLRKLTTEQLNKVNELFNMFKSGDVFSGTRQIETLSKNTELKHVKTERQIIEALIPNVPVEQLKSMSSDWKDYVKSPVALAQANPIFNWIINEFRRLTIIKDMNVQIVEDDINRLAKAARQSRKRSLLQKLIPTDELVWDYVNERDIEMKTMIAKTMTKEELEYAHYMSHGEFGFDKKRDYLIEKEVLNHYFDDESYFTHIRRGFLEAWLKSDSKNNFFSVIPKFITAVGETIFQKNRLEQKTLNILNGRTGEILPLEKYFPYKEHRTGNLIPTKNMARVFLQYHKTFELKKMLDQIMPKAVALAQAVAPSERTEKGLEMDTSMMEWVKDFFNTQKGRSISISKVVVPGNTIDTSLKLGVLMVRYKFLAYNFVSQVTSPIGEQYATFIQLGTKKYTLGLKRSKLSKQGKKIAEKYKAIIGEPLFDRLAKESAELGSKIGETAFMGFGIAARQANLVSFLGQMTKEEFESGEVSDKRLTEIENDTFRWRSGDKLKGIMGSTSVGYVVTQFRSWAIKIAEQSLVNVNKMIEITKKDGFKSAAQSREFGELFRATVPPIILMLIMYHIYKELRDKEDKTFLEKILYKAMNEISSSLQALSPATFLSLAPLQSVLTDLASSLVKVGVGLSTGDRTATGEIEGVSLLKKTVTPTLFKGILEPSKEEQAIAVVSKASYKAKSDLEDIEKGLVNIQKETWEQVKELGVGTKEATDLLNKKYPDTEEGDTNYKIYQKIKQADMNYWNDITEKVIPIVKQASVYGFSSEEAKSLVSEENMTDDEFVVYKKIKNVLYPTNKEQEEDEWEKQTFLQHVVNISKGWTTDPVDAFSKLVKGGDWKITELKNGQIIVNRMPTSASEAIKKEAGKNNANYRLDHIWAVKAGGGSDDANLNIITKEEWEENTPVEVYLIKQLDAGNITGKQAKEYMIRFKIGRGQIKEGPFFEKYNSVPISFQKIKETIGQR